MADGVKIPVDIDISNISWDRVDFKGVSDAISHEIDVIQKQLRKFYEQAQAKELTKSVASAFNSLQTVMGKVSAAMKAYGASVTQAVEGLKEYADANEKLKAIQEEIDYGKSLLNQAEINGDIQAVKELRKQLAEVEKERSEAAVNAQTESWINLADTRAILDVRAKLTELLSVYGRLRDAATHFNESIGQSTPEIQQSANAETTLTRNAERASAATAKLTDGLTRNKSIMASLRNIVGTTGNIFAKTFNGAKVTVSALAKGFKALTGLIGKIGSGIKNLISKFNVLSKNGNSAVSGLSGGFKKLQRNILMFGFGFRTAYFAIKRLRTIFTDAFKTMAAQFPELNAQLNMFTMALNRLKGSLGTMFQPIISVAIPILARLMEYLSQAMEAVASFFAVLTGQKVIYRATSNQEDYAASLHNTAKAEKAARKEHEKTVASYDKLDIIPQDKPGSSTGSGSVASPDLPLNVTYEKADVDKAVSEFAQMIKDAWANADFTEVGKYLTEKALAVLEFVRVNIVPKVTDFINRLAYSITTFVDGFDFSAIGGKIGEIVNDIVNQLDATAIGEAFASIRNAVIRFVDGLVTEIDWSQLGTKLAEGLMGFVNKLDIQTAIHALTTFLTGLGQTIQSFASTVDWEGLGNTIVENLNLLFSTLDITTLGTGLGTLFTGILTTLTTVLTEADWSGFIQSLLAQVDTILNSIQEKLMASDNPVLVTIGTVIEGLRGALTQLWPTIQSVVSAFMPIVDAILPAIQALAPLLVPISQILAVLAANVMPIIVSLIQTLMPIITKIIEHLMPIFQTVLTALQPIFDVITERVLPFISRLLAAIWPLIEGILQCVTSLLGPIMDLIAPLLEIVMDILDPILEIITPLFDILGWLFKLLGQLLAPIIRLITPLLQILTKLLQPLTTLFTAILTPILRIIIGLVQAIENVLSAVFIPIMEVVTSVIQSFSDFLSTIIEGIVEWIESIGDTVDKIWEGIKGVLNGILGFVEGVVNKLIGGINKLIKGVNKISFDVPDWVPVLGGKKFGFNIKEISEIHIPRLAEGAVIPPNKQFLAMLGDQSHGTNIEAPLDTIKQALIEALTETRNTGSASQPPIVLQLDGKTVAEVVWSEEDKHYKQTGRLTGYRV